MTAASRWPAAVALGVLLALLAAVIVLTTPWVSLPAHGLRVPVDPHRDFTAAQLARENAFHRAVRPPAYLSLLVSFVLVMLLGLTSLGSRLAAALARPLGGGWAWQAVLGGVAVVLLSRLVALPFDMRAEAVLRRYGLSTQDWGGWFLDQARTFLITLVLVVAGSIAFFAVVHRFPKRWWVVVGLAIAGFVVLASYFYPLLVEPVFNKFTPLPDGPLRTSIVQLAERDGLHVDRVLVADASRRTTTLNAYVSGFGHTKRVVLYDTLLRSATPDEVRLIVAHELGHAKRQDVLHGTLIGALGAAAGACALYLALSFPWLLRRAGVSTAGDARAIALVIALLTLVSTLTGPLQNLISRRIEARADVHSLDLTRDPATFVASEKRLALRNISDLNPSPLVYGWFATHPTSPERIALARTWARLHQVAVP